MRKDLDFLYRKAMRSKDIKFINEVFMLCMENTLFWDEANNLDIRLSNLGAFGDFDLDHFSFLIGDSQMGTDWYRNRK